MSLALIHAVFASTAFAGADLETTIDMPAGYYAYEEQTIEVHVDNVGNRNARNVSLSIQLPETNTSPTVHVMGDVGSFSGACSQSGTQLDCSWNRIKKNKGKTVQIAISLPQSAASLDFDAAASTTSSEANLSNNTDYDSAEVLYDDLVITGPAAATNQHCTGTGLVAFYECTLYPSSISSHQIVFEDDNTITFVGISGYDGDWWQPTDDSLAFTYETGGSIVAEFYGNAVDGDCFEGLTTFPGSSYVAPYEVCLD